VSTTYSGNAANNPASITIPSDGDDADASSVNVAFEALMDKVVHVLNGFTTFASNKTFSGEITLSAGLGVLRFDNVGRLQIDPLLMQLRNDAGEIQSFERCVSTIGIRQSTNANWFPIENTLSIGATYLFPLLEIPNQCEITSIKLTHNPNNGTAPLTKVATTILRIPRDASGAVDEFTPIADPATGSGYTDLHVFTATPGSPVVVDLALNSYFLKVVAETGGSAVPGVLSAQPVIVYLAPFIDLAK
jgi:hypothetical protein